MRKLTLGSLALLCAAALPLAAHATSFTYNVNENFGTSAVMGTITTDIDSGTVTTLDITGFNLLLSQGTNTFDLTDLNSIKAIFGNYLQASSTDLTYNFSGTGFSGAIFQNQTNFLCLDGPDADCFGGTGQGLLISLQSTGQIDTNYLSGTQVIGTMASPVPEPSTLALLGTGVLGLFGLATRRLGLS